MNKKIVTNSLNLVKSYLKAIRHEDFNVSNQRQFFTLPDFTNKKKVYRRKELVGYSMQQMYAVVSDVENYKSFVPYCKKSKLFAKSGNTAKGEIQVGFPPLRESYTSNLTFNEPNLVKSECFDGRLFNYLLNHWAFSPGVKDVPDSCVIDFRVEFEFKSALHSNLSHLFFDLVVQQMEGAFVAEACRRYGKPKIGSHVLTIEKS
ncbi:Coenzyme Q-binding protein COQ10, mitochondrial [Pseudolycoriella hygida]|uniref:Coenzyme Q-binding protein COQ10, mitochondrial n=1 Tax=Pseudolycoriella hygida TaxID=35572 RepID=A0A9Q0S3E3_9DIPT|nr:Coenzyme Q-binding protein COQ10, mitochondrial [Pseudolycoriella hygida]